MKIAIIGAGAAGLAGIKHCLEETVECVAFEQSGVIGGTWNYIEDVEEHTPLFSPMYSGLRTNLPTQLMEYENFHYKPTKDHYIAQPKVLEYIHEFAKQFNLLPHVKFHHQVKFVDLLPNEKWIVRVQNIQSLETTEDIYDGVLICNGHYSVPSIPSIPGIEEFKGDVIHSFFYRTVDKYQGKRVLIIGGGPSGVDIYRLVAKVAEKIFLSINENVQMSLPKGAILKPIVSRFNKHRVIFKDGTEEEIDSVILCTGYEYTLPFLSDNCQLTVDDNWTKPLYKHIVNIEHPSMAIVNTTYAVCPFPLFSIQVRFYLALLKGHFHMCKEKMYEEYNKEIENRTKENKPKKSAHIIGHQMLEYCEDLAKTANIRPIPLVIGKMFKYLLDNKIKCAFNVINDEEFEPIFLSDSLFS